MLRLHQTFGAHTGRVLDFDRNVIRFGRLPDNEVVFDAHADLDASGRHAEIRREGGQWVLHDVGSRNGTFIAGRRVTRYVLTSGDEIEFGLGGPRIRVEFVASMGSGATTKPATPLGLGESETLAAPAVTSVPPGPAPPATSLPAASFASGEKRYGQRTVGMMIQAALEQVERQRGAVAERSSRGLKIALGLLAFLVVVVLGAVVALFAYTRWQEKELRDENVRLQRELATLGEGESSERRRLERRIEALNAQLAAQQEAAGARIAEDNEQAVYIVLVQPSGSARSVLCSAFTVRSRILATSARCVSAIERAVERRRQVHVVANRGRGEPMRIERMWRHPAYVPDQPHPSPDVGLLQVDRVMARQVRIATMAELAQLRVGDDVFVYGFPKAIAPSGAPVAVMTSGLVGRLTAFDGTEVDPAQRHLVSHSAFSDGGTAGSPMFDRHGRVVGINAGNFRGRTRVVDSATRIARTVDTETAYAWGVRVDLLLSLLAGLPDEP